MADNFNSMDAQVNALIDALNRLVNEGNATVFDIVDMKRQLEQALKDFPLSEIRELRDRLKDNNQEVRDAINDAERNNDQRIRAEQEYREKTRQLTKELNAINDKLNDANLVDVKYLEDKRTTKQKELEDLKNQHQAYIEDREEQYNLEKELENRRTNVLESLTSKLKEAGEKFVDTFYNSWINLLTDSVNKVNSAYTQHASTMSAALDVSVRDINQLQKDIASSLREQSLNKALSGTAIFEEANKLVGSGYTNEGKLQASAEGLSVAREIAPNISVDTTQVKNLTNIFGNDFIIRFAAIQAAVQDTAGSTVGLNESLQKLMTDLEPVYTNAELNSQALQDTSDIEATLTSLREQGLITGDVSTEQLNAIKQLLDPATAISSNNIMVRSAASQYGLDIWGSDNPVMAAFQALQSTTQNAYENVGMSGSGYDRLSRGLVAGVYGNTSTMNASWLGQNYLQGIDVKPTENLDTTYETQLGKLVGGLFTTQAEQESNVFENSATAQSLATIEDYYPKMYAAIESSVVPLLKSLPIKIAGALKLTDIISGGLSKVVSGIGSGALTAGATGGTLRGIGSVLFGGASSTGAAGAGTLGGLSAGAVGAGLIGAAGVTAGLIGAYNLHNQWDSNRSFTQNIGFGGDKLSSMLNFAGMGAGAGAAIGTVFGGPAGTVIGTGIGAVAGGITGLITALSANKESQKANTEALEKQTQSTKDLFGKNVTAATEMEAKAALARGGGIAHLNSGDYQIDYTKSNYDGFARGLDYVPYDDYVVRAHKGEAIISAKAAEKLRKKDPNFFNDASDDGVNIVNALREQTESIVDAVNGEKKYSPLTQRGPRTYIIKNIYA